GVVAIVGAKEGSDTWRQRVSTWRRERLPRAPEKVMSKQRLRIDRAEPLLEKAPVDRPAELGQRVVRVDDLVEPRPEQIVLPAVPPLLGPHRITLRQADGETESRPNDPINLQDIKPPDAAFL